MELLDQLIKEKITPEKFFYKFSEKIRGNGEVLNLLESKLVLLSPHKKSLDFSDFVEEILDYCESFNDDEPSDSFIESYDLLDKEFRDSIEKIYFKIQKFLEK